MKVGLFDWLKRKDAGDASATPDAATPRDVSGDLQDPQQRAALEQADHLLHELLAGDAGQGSAGGLTVTASTQVIVGGQTVTPDDPRAREAMSKAAAKLRAQGMDELAADLEARAASVPAAMAPAAAAGAPPRRRRRRSARMISHPRSPGRRTSSARRRTRRPLPSRRRHPAEDPPRAVTVGLPRRPCVLTTGL